MTEQPSVAGTATARRTVTLVAATAMTAEGATVTNRSTPGNRTSVTDRTTTGVVAMDATVAPAPGFGTLAAVIAVALAWILLVRRQGP